MALYAVSLCLCVLRWRLVTPAHRRLTVPFLANAFLVGCFFNTILPTTVGGDVVRGYDLIKATGRWRESLASILMDRMLGVSSFLFFGVAAWAAFPPAREDPMLRSGFYGFCAVVTLSFSVLISRRLLRGLFRPFARIGLGQLESHAKQLQETLREYLRDPKRLLAAFGVSMGIQALTISMFIAVARALDLPIPLLLLILVVPIVVTVSQLPISLNGWGIREAAVVLLLGRIGIGAPQALSLSLLSAVIPLLSGVAGAAVFLTRRRRKS